MQLSYSQSKRRGWRRSWTFVAATTGATIGLGNIWKFSYLAGEHGGSAFIMLYLLCLLLVAMPVMIAELLLGRRGRANPITSVQNISIEAGVSVAWQSIAWLGCVAGLLILSYYSVVAGWSLAYVGKLFGGEFTAGSAQLAGDHFQQLLASPRQMMIWQSIFLAAAALIVMLGVRTGLARLARLLIPLLLLMLIALALYSSQVGDLDRALVFLFEPDFQALTVDTLLVALGHAFFTLSVGAGVMLTYGGYSPDRRSIVGMVSVVVVMDTLVSILAGLVIFPLLFSFNMAPAMGPGLMFIAMPYGFGNMLYGSYFGALFFSMVSLAALTSAVALLEPVTVWLVERWRCWRPVAALVVAASVWLLAAAIIASFNLQLDVGVATVSVFHLVDFITANILLPLGGLLIALFVGWRLRPEVLGDELGSSSRGVFLLWYWLLRYIAVPGVLLIFITSIYQNLV